MAVKSGHLMVAALDFGTTYSGYAFSMIHDFKVDPLKIQANQAWNSGGGALLSLKTPTCILLNGKKEFVAFGYEAENKYADIVLDEEQDDYYYFHRFKMNLHSNKNITTEMTLEDLSGKSVAAIHVFGLSIKALVGHLMDMVKTQGSSLKMNEIQWVLTVPAIWTDSAKQFMRESAEMAGIPPERLILALEPEAASIFCQYLPTVKVQGNEEELSMAKTGTRYMVVDLGGGTADITVHENMADGKLKELCRADGNDCGGTSVDARFFQLLVKILGGPLMKSIKDENLMAYLDLFREFETVKRTIDSSKTGKINMTVPYVALDKMCKKILKEEFSSAVESSIFRNEISLRGDKLRFNVETMIKLFTPTVDSIVVLINDILKNKTATGVTHILLVGGFSECRLVQERVNNAFPNKKIIIPSEAGLSVLKGAVLFGHRPDYIHSRVMRFSYGLESIDEFDEKKHDIKYLEEIDGVKHCMKTFLKLVSKDEVVPCGAKVKKDYSTVFRKQKIFGSLLIHIYRC